MFWFLFPTFTQFPEAYLCLRNKTHLSKQQAIYLNGQLSLHKVKKKLSKFFGQSWICGQAFSS